MTTNYSDMSAVLGNLIALAALSVSIYSLCKSRKVEALQAKVAELDSKLKEQELAEVEEGRKACVEARYMLVGKSRRIRFCNVGKEPAREVYFEVLDERVAGLVAKDHVPFPELEHHKEFDEAFCATLGIPRVFDVRVTWKDGHGACQSKISHISF